MQNVTRTLFLLLVFTFLASTINAAPADDSFSRRRFNFAQIHALDVPYGDAWTDNYEAAKTKAQAEGKLLFMLFSGSDWCSWCKKFHKTILSKKRWLDYAEERFVLLLVDFPKHYQQSAELKAQNKMLAKKYNVNGLPHVMIFKGDELVTVAHYMNNHTAGMYIDYLENLLPPR